MLWLAVRGFAPYLNQIIVDYQKKYNQIFQPQYFNFYEHGFIMMANYVLYWGILKIFRNIFNKSFKLLQFCGMNYGSLKCGKNSQI